MSKYQKLWEHIKNVSDKKLVLSFEEIEKIIAFPIDHSFLTSKKELLDFGWEVEKISMKNKNISFKKTEL
ncbi:MAG: hypothetical protein MJ198_00555 [Bacteroidales bacterium]|nr:hypothetical protein [Bacteroidales bacterium]